MSLPSIQPTTGSKPPSSTYTARVPRRPNGSATYRQMLASYGVSAAPSTSPRERSSSGQALSSRPASSGTRSVKSAQLANDSSFVGAGSYLAPALSSPRHGRMGSAEPGASNNSRGVFRQHAPVPPAPRTLMTQRIVDIASATAPITQSLVNPTGGTSPISIQFPEKQGATQQQHQHSPQPSPRGGDSGVLFRASGRNCVRAALGGRDCDAVEVAYSVFGPALANLSTAQTLSTLERECHVAQLEERYVDAQICHDLLNQVAQNCADRAQRVVQDKIKKLQPVQAKFEENREETIRFTKLWEKELQAYDAKGEAALNELKQKHARMLHEQSQLLESQLSNIQPHYSRRVIDLRIELEKLVALKQFREADGVNKELVHLERKEKQKFEQMLNKKYQKSVKLLTDAHALQFRSLKDRIAAGREELLGQRREDYRTLIQRHAIRVGDVDHKARAQLQQEHKYLEREAVVMARRPANAVDMFSEYEERRRLEQQHQQLYHQQPVR